MSVLQFILNRLNEASTWRGIILLATSALSFINPKQAQETIGVGIALVGVINIFLKEVGSPDSQKPTNTDTSETTKTVVK